MRENYSRHMCDGMEKKEAVVGRSNCVQFDQSFNS